ncbi:uncharacterized protein E0L32_000035 [Thyridium curvatum]|uniref:Fork-head domain-containing protein n=1 Tax=Thyridium curvatum TaxID=1093900 RepID=A0A507BFG1_9PEZI|nr:uncharacterized protein E0L32_000035 [Thyridium curvatum]TPX15701.1 hypothetical protein E0L32_000035 [Thyridium curvatum]
MTSSAVASGQLGLPTKSATPPPKPEPGSPPSTYDAGSSYHGAPPPVEPTQTQGEARPSDQQQMLQNVEASSAAVAPTKPEPDSAPAEYTGATTEATPSTPVATVPKTEPQDLQPNTMNLPSFYNTPQNMPLYPANGMSSDVMAMIQLARIANAEVMSRHHGNTVTPAEVSMLTPSHEMADPLTMGNGANTTAVAAAMSQGLESFARIEFADSVFQMTTYAVIIGRDQRALNQARLDEKRKQEYNRQVEEYTAKGLPVPAPPSPTRGKFSKSYVSEEGGMLGPESDGDENPRPSKRRKTHSAAGSSSHNSHQHQEDAVEAQQPADAKSQNLISNRQYVSHTPGAATVDLESLRPSPHHVPFIGIHSPGPDIASRTKAISREHLKIRYNREKGVFEAIPLHRNGFFRDDIHYKDEPVILKSGDRLQIKDVDFAFIINGVKHGCTGAEDEFEEEETSSKRYSEGGKEMSFEFESSHAGEVQETSDEEEAAEGEESDKASADGDEREADEDEVMETVELDEQGGDKAALLDPLLGLPMPPKKRGPGRPPKNGIMSKREERLRKKLAQEQAKKTLPQLPPGEPPVKRKVGRPRKHPLPENAGDKPEKRKYKPRKPKNPEDGAGSDPEKAIKEKRREKPKTPPLELKVEDFTPAQLEKPNKNYGVLIDEVLSEAPPEGLTLKQIYKRIQKKYPFYYFNVETKGWESSVRHNLIGNDAFRKNEETHLWSRIPGIELDAGKKRKANSPDQSTAALHNLNPQWNPQMPHPQFHGDHMAAGPHGFRPSPLPAPTHGLPIVNNQAMANPPNFQPQPGLAGSPPQGQNPARPAFPLPPQAPAPAQLPGYGPAAVQRQLQMGAQAGSYSSPYAPKPPQTPAAGGAAGQQAPVIQRPAQPATAVPRPQGQMPQPGVPAGQPSSVAAASSATVTPAVAGASNGAAVTLKPVVDPELFNFLKTFKNQVISQLEKRFNKAEAIAMSVINRGIGLSTESIVPEHENIEKIISGVFDTAKKKFPDSKNLDPKLISILTTFKAGWVDTLKPKLGQPKSEALLLSAIDRVLGFTDKSIMHPANDTEKEEFEQAENLFMPHIKQQVEQYQRTISLGR